jgi:F-type H+-transporting ATPase subunit gamma
MPSLKDIRRRITSVRNTQKITRAMKLVSAAKFARANTAVIASRPYGKAFDDMVARLVDAAGEEVESPLLASRPEKKSLVAILSSDRGFCGGLNANLFKAVLAHITDKRKEGVEIALMPLGKRARQFASKVRYTQVGAREKVLDKPTYENARLLSEEMIKAFTDGGYDRVYLAFVEFKSALAQTPRVVQLLPMERQAASDSTKLVDSFSLIIEPKVTEILHGLLSRQVASRVFRSMLESAASEHGARMTAMDGATNNASKVLKRIKIQYNRARQAAITKELIEITSGAQAL